MANRYWVGGAGTWNATSTTNWSTSSGGASGASVPTAADSVFFDQAGTYTVTCTGALTCNDITVSAGTVTFATGTSPTFAISGSMSLVAGTVWSATGTITFNATTTGKTITTNGVTLSGYVTFNGVGGGWTLGSALTLASLQQITVTNGTFSTSASNYAVTASVITINGGTVTLNGSTVNLGNTSPFNYSSGTFNAGTSTINLTGSAIFAGAGLTFYDVTFPTTVTSTTGITGANTFNNLKLPAAGLSNLYVFTLSADQIINGTFSSYTGGLPNYRIFVQSNVQGTTRTLTCAAASPLTDIDFRDITIAGAAAPVSGTRLGDCKGNSGITFTSKTVYLQSAPAAIGQVSPSCWALTPGGATNNANMPLAQDTIIIQASTPAAGNSLVIDGNYNIGTLDMSARTSAALTLSTGTTTPIFYGDVKIGSAVSITGTGALTFGGRGSQTITSAGKTFTQPITLNSLGGTLTLQDAFTTSRAAAGAFTLTNGTLDLNGKTLTLSDTTTATFLTAAGTKNITFNGGTIAIATSGVSFNNAAPTGFTTTAGTGTGTISMTSAGAKTFVGGGSTFNCVLNQGGAGALTINGSNTLQNITNTYSATGATTISLAGSTPLVVANFTASGSAGKLLTFNTTIAGTQKTITLTGGGTVSVDYLNVQDIAFTPAPATDGTTPYVWYLGANSTNSGNNTGGLFQAGGTGAIKVYQITNTATTTWTVPSDWNSSNNTIYLIGGGGGGGGSRATSTTNKAGGAGGGGGGYTAVTNYSTTPSSSITVAVGTAGTAGTNTGGTGGTGGTTSWAVTNTATGGTGGSTTATPTSVGGTGGSGTYSGGNGGAGSTTTTSGVIVTGGGGGGAGGPNGAGGAGGIGFANATSANTAGGGGGVP